MRRATATAMRLLKSGLSVRAVHETGTAQEASLFVHLLVNTTRSTGTCLPTQLYPTAGRRAAAGSCSWQPSCIAMEMLQEATQQPAQQLRLPLPPTFTRSELAVVNLLLTWLIHYICSLHQQPATPQRPQAAAAPPLLVLYAAPTFGPQVGGQCGQDLSVLHALRCQLITTGTA
jgi:hypothetical protein